MPRGDITPVGCPQAGLHGEALETLSGRPTMTARAAEITCKSQASSTQTALADKKLKQRPVVDLPRMGEEELKGISSKGSSQRPRTSTPVERAPPQVAESEPMDVDNQEVPSTTQAPVLARQSTLKTKGRVLHTHKLGRPVHASAMTRRLNNMPLTSRAFALW